MRMGADDSGWVPALGKAPSVARNACLVSATGTKGLKVADVMKMAAAAAASPRPSLTTDTAGSRKRFSLWTRGSSKRNSSKAGKIGELGEILSDGEEEAAEEAKKVQSKPSKEKVPPVKEEKAQEAKEDKDKAKDNKAEKEEGNVTNSLAMLTAIPEVDLGMEYVLTNFAHCHIADARLGG